jgi:hypothetical protein
LCSLYDLRAMSTRWQRVEILALHVASLSTANKSVCIVLHTTFAFTVCVCVCMHQDDADPASVPATDNSVYTYDSCANSLLCYNRNLSLLKVLRAPLHLTVSTSLPSSLQLVPILKMFEPMVYSPYIWSNLLWTCANLTQEFMYLKKDNACMRVKLCLRSLLVASPKGLSSVSSAGVVNYPQHQDQPAAVDSTHLTHRDAAATGTLPGGSSSLPNNEGFQTVTYKRVTTARSPPVATTNKRRRQPPLGARNTPSLSVVSKTSRSIALFVPRFSPEVTADDVHKSIVEQLRLDKLVCTRL